MEDALLKKTCLFLSIMCFIKTSYRKTYEDICNLRVKISEYDLFNFKSKFRELFSNRTFDNYNEFLNT